jgi:hypothetical protein
MRQYKGAVFFVDMLGIGALTRKKVELTSQDFDAWGITRRSDFNEHVLCAKLLMKFRSCLAKIKKKHRAVKIAQLSDCAFIWSDDHLAVAMAAQEMMMTSVGAGLLCRGGIAYGDIVEPNRVAESLGQFVLGEAATKAVEFEKLGKGCRVFTDEAFGLHMSSGTRASNVPYEAVAGLRNPLTGEVIHEFCWYFQHSPGTNPLTKKVRHQNILKLLSMLMGSPLFRWNCSSLPGMIQMACSVGSLSSATQVLFPNPHTVYTPDMVMHGFADRSDALHSRLYKKWCAQAAPYFIKKK